MPITQPRRRLKGFVVAWEFHINPKKRPAFERIYGPEGEWVQLFRTSKGYLRTELFRDRQVPGRYLTLDYWQSLAHYEKFKMQNRAAYHLIDKKCETLTVRETEIGRFTRLP
jgi:heme-degrading monooxygenase HmoA